MADNVIKSVGRVFEILEMFERERRALGAIEIARELGYPHTSTLAILKSIQALGYLSLERDTWSFSPTQALPRLTEWVTHSLQQETIILEVMKILHSETGETINLSQQSGEFIKIVHGLESVKAVAISVRQGVLMPINASHTGMVALASQPDDSIARIIRKLRSVKYPEARSISVKEAMVEVNAIRKAQYAPGYDLYINGIGAVCFPLEAIDHAPYVIGVVGPSDRIRSEEKHIISVAKKAVAETGAKLAYPK